MLLTNACVYTSQRRIEAPVSCGPLWVSSWYMIAASPGEYLWDTK